MDDKYIGKLLDDRYEILERIGAGGMAVVYKARCHRLNRFVAIKILKSDMAQNPDLRRRFHAESQAVAMLSHPNIVSVYDVSTSDNIDYIVMELIEGITLKQYINRKGILNWKEALHFTTQIVKALEHAHSRGIIHRDIKPHNIMILKDGNVKVADFGIARLLTTQNTLTQEALGSVHYISPEQAKGGAVDARSDIYSVGVVMYEMLTSRLPFEGDSPVSIAIQHISAVPLQPREINPDIPIGLEDITMHAMDPNLNTRYASATELLRDLEEFRKNPSVQFNYSSIPNVAGDDDEATRKIPAGVTSVTRSTAQVKKSTGNGITRDHVTKEEYRKNRSKARGTTVLVGVFFIVLFLAGLVWFMWTYALKGWLSPKDEPTVNVPKFIGHMVEDVVTDPANKMYFEFFINKVESRDYPKGYIIEQDPKEDRSVVIGPSLKKVTLTVSDGYTPVLMPNFINKDYRDVEIDLGKLSAKYNLGLVVTSTGESSDYTVGYVFEQKPAADEELLEGMKIYLTYSTGPANEQRDMPTLIGLTEAQAMLRLERADLVGKAEYENNEADEGIVFFQEIEPGTQVEAKREVIFYVSLGPKIVKVDVPNVVSLTRAQALSDIRERQLKPSVKEEYSDVVAEGRVISQTPVSGTEVDQGATVTIVVSLGPAPAPPENPTPPEDDPTPPVPVDPVPEDPDEPVQPNG